MIKVNSLKFMLIAAKRKVWRVSQLFNEVTRTLSYSLPIKQSPKIPPKEAIAELKIRK
jgi:hypothetical protein